MFHSFRVNDSWDEAPSNPVAIYVLVWDDTFEPNFTVTDPGTSQWTEDFETGISNFDTYTQGSGSWTYNIVSPAIGTGSINFGHGGYTTGGGNIVVTGASGRTKGITAGRLRTLIKPINWVGSDTTARLYCMQSNEDLTSSSDFYTVYFQNNNTWQLQRVSGGTLSSAGTFIKSGTWTYPGSGNIRAVELSWFYDFSEFGGVRFTVKDGSATNYSDLADTGEGSFYDNQDGSHLTTSVAEGLGAEDFGAGFSFNVTFDEVQLYTVAAA
jgi:hypothetical protein